MPNEKLRISLVQYDIAWENKSKNIAYIEAVVTKHCEETDVFILPEMCTTAFTFETALAEPQSGETISKLESLAKKYDVAICGSFLCSEEEKYYNRGFFITPSQSYFYDKRHLFRMGKEGEVLTAGNKKLIVPYKGFNICLLVCYDLRFPVWARNRNNEYDLLIYVANWPEGRKEVWKTLLQARAIENMSYVCGVNRVGKDNNKLNHTGLSVAINPRGEKIVEVPENKEEVMNVIIEKEALKKDREHFAVWKDADRFEINL